MSEKSEKIYDRLKAINVDIDYVLTEGLSVIAQDEFWAADMPDLCEETKLVEILEGAKEAIKRYLGRNEQNTI